MSNVYRDLQMNLFPGKGGRPTRNVNDPNIKSSNQVCPVDLFNHVDHQHQTVKEKMKSSKSCSEDLAYPSRPITKLTTHYFLECEEDDTVSAQDAAMRLAC